ncbi:hypothetical protein [Mycolicibacterium sp. D5.8-2]|uniref:hypothetical protein n=1 Tax=Mycolicibacterium sp. D5.8-2 TaxID=3085903 RepID=UPI00298C9F02|nr:hypothetical protein [Mycolicibacterium sp. D5.8-2]MDW5614774.1 hypothetical protein [Mycolicibacterium sp. D5.8-2]
MDPPESSPWLCAKEALETPAAVGMWSGVHLPKDGRGRMFALRQLRSLAAYGGYTVSKKRGQTPPVTGQE